MGALPIDVATAGAAIEMLVELEDPWFHFGLDFCFFHSSDRRIAQSAAGPESGLRVEPEAADNLAQLFRGAITHQAERFCLGGKPVLHAAAREHYPIAGAGQFLEFRRG